MQFTQLANGVSIATNPQTGTTQAALALFVVSGVRAQTAEEAGYAHLVEHLLFEAGAGTAAFDEMGSTVNAYTGREHIALTGLVSAGKAVRLLEQFARMLLEVQFSDASIAAERERIQVEDALSRTSQADCTEQAVVETIWPSHAIAQPLSGSTAAATAASLQRFWRRSARGNRVFVFGVGAINHGQIEAAAQPLSRLPAASALDWESTPHFASGARREFCIADGVRSLWILPMPAPHQQPDDAAEILQCLLSDAARARLSGLRNGAGHPAWNVATQVLRYSDASALMLELEAGALDANDAHAACERALEQLAHHGFTPRQFHHAQQVVAASRAIEFDHLDAQLERLADRVLFRRDPNATCSLEWVNEVLHRGWPQHASVVLHS